MKKVTLTTPEARPAVASHAIIRMEVDVRTGRCDCIVLKTAADGTELGAYRAEITMPDKVAKLVEDLYKQGQQDGVIPAGNVQNA